MLGNNDIINSNWDNNFPLDESLLVLRDRFCAWNKNVCVISFLRKQRVLARLGGEQQSMSTKRNCFLDKSRRES